VFYPDTDFVCEQELTNDAKSPLRQGNIPLVSKVLATMQNFIVSFAYRLIIIINHLISSALKIR